MRQIAHAIFSLFWTPEDDQMPKIVNEYHDHYNRIDKLLQDMPGVLKLIHDDLAALSKETVRHREAEFTTENLLRAIVLMQSEGWNLRETTIRIAQAPFFQNFCRLLKRKTIDFTLLSRAFNTVAASTTVGRSSRTSARSFGRTRPTSPASGKPASPAAGFPRSTIRITNEKRRRSEGTPWCRRCSMKSSSRPVTGTTPSRCT